MTLPDPHALPRQRLLVLVASMLEALYDPAVVRVLATLRPADMRPGGARVPGTSYELEAATAVRAMRELLALRGVRADRFTERLAAADIAARSAMLHGTPPPVLASLYACCTDDLPGSEAPDVALRRLYLAAERLFTNTHMRRLDRQCFAWSEQPATIDQMPVQQFIASFVRNAPP